MKCPRCNQDTLHPQYRLIQPTMHLDAATPAAPQRELAALVCEACSMLWYAFPRETAGAALKRIRREEENMKEEPHP